MKSRFASSEQAGGGRSRAGADQPLVWTGCLRKAAPQRPRAGPVP